MKKAAEAWLVEQKLHGEEDPAYITLREEGSVAKAKAIAYAHWLVTTMNDALPTYYSQVPQPHPCACEWPCDSNNADYHDLVNTIERHTQCSAAYCLRCKPGQDSPTCRFNYPRDICNISNIQFQELPNGTVRATLSTKWNDPWLNSHQ